MGKRSFVMRAGKPQIKRKSRANQGHISYAETGSKCEQIYRADKMVFARNDTCSFIRPYIAGEYDGFALPDSLDLEEITHTYVISGTSEDHISRHLEPIGQTYKAMFFDVEGNVPVHVRVPLLPEQREVLKQASQKGEW